MTIIIPEWLMVILGIISLPFIMIVFFSVGAGMRYVTKTEDDKKVVSIKRGSEMAKIRH